jgi:hypothetical protein
LTAQAEQLARELLDYKISIDQHANDRYGALPVEIQPTADAGRGSA